MYIFDLLSLTELSDKKCKRCGIYEKDSIKPDDTFDEWELCASDFTKSDGKYTHYLKKEFKATFLCPECVPHRDGGGGARVLATSSAKTSSAALRLISSAILKQSEQRMELQDIVTVLPRCLRRGYRDSELPREDRDEDMNHTKELLNDTSGEAREREIMAVLGVSGSGKSTLIDALADRIARESLRLL
ncbi:hypothetical protein RND71_035878 [Anisodus tanguticus]|uniref:DUF7953 domain-containing protein n=1 Tax=Anisodus tanguticus TaxID=243964 RepID=A0AAE1R7Q5_9SOLA|nr:hypothetical protein RND71_035878 [Anisodus tanguticus]